MLTLQSFIVTLFLFIGCTSGGNTTCISSELDWYTNAVGETPCKTYERLRQICNQNYQVGNFRPLTPGDNCDDQLAECCCNSVSFALSMLCMNCQQCAQGPGCIDAGTMAYGIYQNFEGGTCSERTRLVNQNFTADIQSAICSRGIHIPKALYNIFWSDGAWFYVFTRDSATKDFIAHPDDAFYPCPSTSASSTSTPSAPTPSPTAPAASISSQSQRPGPNSASSPSTNSSGTVPLTGAVSNPSSLAGSNENQQQGSANGQESSNDRGQESHSTNTGAIAGGVVGGLAALAFFVFALVFWKRHARQHRRESLDLSSLPSPAPPIPGPSTRQVTRNTTFPLGTLPSSKRPLSGLPLQLTMGESLDPFSASGSSIISASGFADGGEGISRHIDAGPYLSCSDSGRLPPSYGQWPS